MKKNFLVIPVIAAFLVITGMHIQNNFTTEEGLSKMEKTGVLEAKTVSGSKKILTVYFSHSGNTREIANQVRGIVGGDIFEIQAVNPYPDIYNEVTKKAKEELKTGFKPALKTKIKNIESYDLVFIGYPIWWGTFPAPVKTFLSEYNLSGKTIAPFCTHEGSGLGRSVSDIIKLCPDSTVMDGLAVRGSSVKKAQNDVSGWLRKIKITQ